jgi:hypothetical protein
MKPRDSLTALQREALRELAGLEPRWTLTGGGALSGFHLGHRTTRDVDLFFRGRDALGDLADESERRLRAVGLDVERLVTAPAFAQLRVTRGADTVLVDLVADPVETIEPPVIGTFDGTSIQLDSMHEILVNKLCTLLGRAELRDLVDVSAILEAGGDLERAAADAPRKDGGFSPLTLAWMLSRYPAARLAAAYGASPGDAERMRAALEARLVELARREAEPP